MTLREAVPYVAAAYLVVWLAILVYIVLIGQKIGRLETELERLEAQVGAPSPTVDEAPARTAEPVA